MPSAVNGMICFSYKTYEDKFVLVTGVTVTAIELARTRYLRRRAPRSSLLYSDPQARAFIILEQQDMFAYFRTSE